MAIATYKIARVQFINGINRKKYDFKIEGLNLQVGDTVVVDAAGGLHLAKVTDLFVNETMAKATKYVISKVDLSAHEKRKEAAKRIKELETHLKKREKAVIESVTRQFISIDPVSNAIKAEIESLKSL